MLERGDVAASFVLTDLDQKPHSPEELPRGGPVLLVFFKILCPTCQFTLPFLERLHQAESEGSPRVFAISQDKRSPTLEFNQEFGITIPTLLDQASDGYPASNAYGITAVPSLFLVGADGKIEWAGDGFHRAELESLARKFGISLFSPGEPVPEMRPG